MKTSTQALIFELIKAAAIARAEVKKVDWYRRIHGTELPFSAEWGELPDLLDEAAQELVRLSGPPVIEPVNPYRPETELVRVPREDEEALTDRRVPARLGLDERTRFDRKGEPND
jgi:hypothetical protein